MIHFRQRRMILGFLRFVLPTTTTTPRFLSSVSFVLRLARAFSGIISYSKCVDGSSDAKLTTLRDGTDDHSRGRNHPSTEANFPGEQFSPSSVEKLDRGKILSRVFLKIN